MRLVSAWEEAFGVSCFVVVVCVIVSSCMRNLVWVHLGCFCYLCWGSLLHAKTTDLGAFGVFILCCSWLMHGKPLARKCLKWGFVLSCVFASAS